MNDKNFDILNYERFVDQNMKPDARSFVYQSSALQIYPLSMAPSLMKTPTPLFRAEYNFLLLFSAGGGQQQIDNELIELQSNDVLFIREGHLNAIQSIDPATEGYFIYLDNGLLPQIFIDRNILNRFTFYPKLSVSSHEMQWLSSCCELIIQQEKEHPHVKEIETSLLKAIVWKLAHLSPTVSPKPDRSSEITMLFKELVYTHFIHEREVTFYAHTLAVSENYLNRCVKHITNKPPKQHITEMVIFHSKLLLQDLSKDISQVAFELNFADPSYFGRLFKQLTQQSPTAYRHSLIQDLSE